MVMASCVDVDVVSMVRLLALVDTTDMGEVGNVDIGVVMAEIFNVSDVVDGVCNVVCTRIPGDCLLHVVEYVDEGVVVEWS